MEISASLEDYLESIYILQQSLSEIRIKDIADHLNIKPPSVTDAMKLLKHKQLVDQEKYGFIRLTAQGARLSERIFGKHLIIQQFLIDVLGVGAEIAKADACKIEHCLSDATIERMQGFLDRAGESL